MTYLLWASIALNVVLLLPAGMFAWETYLFRDFNR